MPYSSAVGGFDDGPLRAFLMDKQVHSLEPWHFVHEGKPFWSVLVYYTMPDAPESRPDSAPNKTDGRGENWRKALTERDWPVFNALREWRKARANEEGIPPYLVFTNEQLTRMLVDKAFVLSAVVSATSCPCLTPTRMLPKLGTAV